MAVFEENMAACAPLLHKHLAPVLKKDTMYLIFQVEEQQKRGNAKASEEALMPLLCAYFKENERQLFQVFEACNDQRYNSSFKIDQTFQAMVGYNKDHGFLFTFDTAETLRLKLCEAKSNVTDLKLHVAAANIGAEDHTNQCGLGSLSRLRMLKALSLFFAHNYTSSAQKSKCLLVSP
ncbi:hypothetical protein HPB49_026631 [Dermacentor silvarum]|nr:hypothetical protein HPB49_026631 [Dermacentor silvarum]